VISRVQSAEVTCEAYLALGRVESVDYALVEHLMQLAEVLDAMDPAHANYPKLITAFAAGEAAIHKRLAFSDDSDDTFDLGQLLAPIRNETD
jgi:cellobiose-specific phosphotransferase system component IIA